MPEFQVLEYLKKEGATNTFRLARVLGIDRQHLLDNIKRWEAKGAVMVKGGTVQFIKFVSEEKAVPEPEKKVPAYAIKHSETKSNFFQTLQSENKQLQLKLSKLKETVKELGKKKSAAPKIITRTIIKRVPVTKTIIKKIRSRPKIVTRIVTKRVPVTRTIIKKIPISQVHFTKKFTRGVWQKIRDQSQKFKIPIKISRSTLLKNLQQLKKPEFV